MERFTVELSERVAQQLAELASEYEEGREQLIVEAIERFVGEEMDLVSALRQGEADIEAGRVHTQEEVEAMFAARWGARDAA